MKKITVHHSRFFSLAALFLGAILCYSKFFDGPQRAVADPPSLSIEAMVRPQVPRNLISTTLDVSYDRQADFVVLAGEDLQAALDAAQPGQVIEIEAGATFLGNFTIRNKVGDRWIYIRSTRYQELPSAGDRVGPEHAHLMPRLDSKDVNVAALNTEYGAHHVRVIGIEITSNKDDNQVVILGAHFPNYETSVEQLAHHITFDRVYVHGNSEYRTKVGIQVKGRHIAIIDSCISEIHHDGQDSQAILGFNTPGPIKISNNYLEAAGENIMFGGADPLITDLIPSDIEIRGNLVSKPLSWKNPIKRGPHAGGKWIVKNLFELKNARRVLIVGNIFEHNWAAAQRGTAIQLTPRNQQSSAPQSTVEDITFRYNIVRDSKNFLNILSSDTQTGTSQTTSRLLFEHNLIYDIDSRLVELSVGTGYPPSRDLIFRHNTMLHGSDGSPNTFLVAGDDTAAENFTFVDNIVTHGQYGFHWPSGTIDDWLINYEFENNVILGGDRHVPERNTIVSHLDEMQFRDIEHEDFRLGEHSEWKTAASDGFAIGADVKAVLQATGSYSP